MKNCVCLNSGVSIACLISGTHAGLKLCVQHQHYNNIFMQDSILKYYVGNKSAKENRSFEPTVFK